MDAKQQCCANYECPDMGETNRGNIKVLSYKEQRYYCMTCGQTFSASRGTTFYRLHTDRQDFVEAVGLLAERCSLRGIARVKRIKPETALRWLEIAGAQAAAVSGELIHDLHLTQVQIDELWTFVKKSHGTSQWMKSSQEWVITGYGPLSRNPRRLRITSYLSQERSEEAATQFIQQIRARSDGRVPFFTSDKLPAYVAALVANYSTLNSMPLSFRAQSVSRSATIVASATSDSTVADATPASSCGLYYCALKETATVTSRCAAQ